MQPKSIIAICLLALSIYAITAQKLNINGTDGVGWNVQTYDHTNFFNEFSFFTDNDPTHGYVNYVSKQQAQQEGLINTNNNKVYIGTDHNNVAGGRGRNAVRLTSNRNYNSGIFVIDLDHMPQGCGTWPAYWLVGPNWPSGGEIDVIEGVNKNLQDQTTLHTSAGCTMYDVPASSFSGRWASQNCLGNNGCGIIANQGNYGAGLNGLGGGVFATVWNSSRIIAYFFTHSQVPADIRNNNPNPNNWGKPYANFVLGGQCPSSHFHNMAIIINLTFCGDWCGAVFAQDCPGLGSCQSYVQNNPSKFADAYWSINYVKAFT